METRKEKLITLLQAADKYAFVKCAEHGSCDECDKLNKGCVNEEKAHYLIQNGVTIQEWVSVDERLPEESGDYLVIENSGAIFKCYYRHEELEFGEYVEIDLDFVEKPYTAWISMNTITHWVPFPALPKGVQ